jgi:uncharacterized protein
VPATAEELSLLVLHEFRHMQLDALRDLVDLHNPHPIGRFMAPWRMDPRPVPALLQGVFAHGGVADYWRVRRLEPDAPPVADVEYAYWRRQSLLAIKALAGSGELTPIGEQFVQVLRKTLESWPHSDLPAVEAMVRAQTIRWRLRNWRPTTAELECVVDAWRSGQPPGAIAAAGTLRTDAEGEPSGIPGIVGVIRNALAGGSCGDAADQAYLDGDHTLAATLFGARLVEDNGDDDWVGFVLAVGDAEATNPVVRERPDLVRAVLDRLMTEDGKVDAVDIAAWLGAGRLAGS